MTIKNMFFTTFISLIFVSSVALAQHKTGVPQAAVAAQNHQQSITGTLEVVVGDPRSGPFTSAVYIFYLREDNGKTTELLLDPSILRIQSEVTGWAGRRVRVSTITTDQILNSNKPGQLLSVSAMTLVADKRNISQSKFRQTTQRIATQSGKKPWVTIYCKFADDPTEPANTGFYERMYSNSPGGLNHYWRESSYELMNIDGSSSSVRWVELRGTYDFYMTRTITFDGETSAAPDLNVLLDHCTYAAAEFVDFSNGGNRYYGINMVFNKTLGCCAFGGIRGKELTGLWETWGITWLPPWAQYHAITAHEMGHAYGLPHSNNWDSDDDPYDNPWDVMSDPFSPQQAEIPWYGRLGQHTNAYHKYELGWISGDQLLEVTAGTTVSTTLDAMGQASTDNHRMALIQIDGNSFYTVEARKRFGIYELAIPDNAIIIHEIVNGRQEPAWAVDSDIPPADEGDNEGTMWRVGETFTSPTGEISVTVDAETAEGFKVTIRKRIALTEPEKTALVEFYNSTNGDNWIDNSNWLVGDPCFKLWFGVECRTGSALKLNLSNNNLVGRIPTALGNLINLESMNLAGNVLSGLVPATFTGISNLADGGGLDLGWNALYTDDMDLNGFLTSKSENTWSSTQTVAPKGLRGSSLAADSVTLAWDAIEYTADTGGYRVLYRQSQGGPYLDGGITANKRLTFHTVSGLKLDAEYYFVVTTETDSHADNANRVVSDKTIELSVTTLSFVTLDDNSLTVSPTGEDDTVNIQYALNEAARMGYTSVRLTAGTFYISSLLAENFKGTLAGTSKASTIIEIMNDSIDCTELRNAGQTSSVIKFVNGEPRIRFMTIRADQPCMNDERIESIVHFTGESTSAEGCANDVIFGAVDRVTLEGSENTLTGPVKAILVSAEGNQLGGCKQTLLGTFKLNRSDVSSFFTGVQTAMRGGAQVDINFNSFLGNQHSAWLHNTNQNTTITSNKFNSVDVNTPSNKGVVIRTQTADAPAITRVVINNNEFTHSSSAGVLNYAIDAEQPGRVANVSAVISNNKFYLNGGNTRGIVLSDISNAHVSANRFTGDGESAVYVSGTAPVSGCTIVANNGLGSFSSISSDVVLDPNTSECIVGEGQGAIVNDAGSDNTIRPQF